MEDSVKFVENDEAWNAEQRWKILFDSIRITRAVKIINFL